jgi:[CysO sulfur-carrier protein]-S-L-cysteine hydrolase
MVVADELVLPAALQSELVTQAVAADPDEACGILAGRDNRVERVFPVRNSADEVEAGRGVFRDRSSGEPAAGRKAVHYYMDPRDQLRVYNEIDALELEVVGYYHSHTHSEARPSATDIRLASDLEVVYVLVGLEDRERPSVRAWRIVKDDPLAESGDLIELPIKSAEY